MRLITEKKQAIIRETFLSPTNVEKKDIRGSDLLSLLLRANMASDLPESARMSDKDIVSQVPTFLIAGVSGRDSQLERYTDVKPSAA